MNRYLHVVIVAVAGIAVLVWAGAFAPQAVGQAPPGFVAGAAAILFAAAAIAQSPSR